MTAALLESPDSLQTGQPSKVDIGEHVMEWICWIEMSSQMQIVGGFRPFERMTSLSREEIDLLFLLRAN
jgi:hypothetical protein